MKVSVIGVGNVGATAAQILAYKQIANEVVLLDIIEGVAEGKATDITQCAPSYGFDTLVTGVTNNFEATKNSDVVVITSGSPRKPGMTREELLTINVDIVLNVTNNVLKHSPNAILIVVTNPLDSITYAVLKHTKLPKNRVIGMGSSLDSARFKFYLSQKTKLPINDIDAMVIGGHGDTTMIPLASYANYKGIPITNYLNEKETEEVVSQTMVGGATLTKMLGTSAWYAPGSSIAYIVEAILNNRKKLIPCATLLEGEYGIQDVVMGVPCVIGKNGIEKVVELKLTAADKEKFEKSAQAIKKVNAEIK
ncbi:malate dehydrogenase [Flavobacterium agricola]|uniref:Malate dehydrogenase n=1 Tax=Flavobacterium agricola TaxID=2870839 RepID=A0ABY6M0U0_9FLAO|nr:malate dehydrogenase [Flavobacterium agricola]UYW00823.1 malate dehydrogenase [Flavobacterium agricola]